MEEMCQGGNNVCNKLISQKMFFLRWREGGRKNQGMLTDGLGMGGAARGVAEMNKS
jgi:hypothetical protein